MEKSNNKIYRTSINIYNSKNEILKGKNLDKTNKYNLLNKDEHNPFRKKINQKKLYWIEKKQILIAKHI